MAFTFLRKNFANTTTQLYMSTGSATAANLIDKKSNLKWVSVGESANNDTATISWVAASSSIISTIILQNHNFANFNIIFNSATQFSPGFSVTSYANSNLFYSFASQAVSSVDVNVWGTQITGTEKACGEFILTDLKITLPTNPDSSGYKPTKYKKGTEFEMIDGGIISSFIAQKFRADLTLNVIPTTTYWSLTSIYNEQIDFIFAPFPVNTFTSSFGGEAWPVIWVGDLDIDMFRNDSLRNGYKGVINLRQIPD